MMDLRSGLPFHWILNGLPWTYPKLEQDARCDLLIVGGGITGALCAYACMRAGIHTTVVDARAIGTGSTCASTALLQYELDTPLHVLARQVGTHRAVQSYRLCAEAIEELLRIAEQVGMADAQRRQSLQFASFRKHDEALEQEYDLRKAHGFPVEHLTAQEVKDLFGFRRSSALLSNLGAEIDPYQLTHHLLQDVIHRGGQVFDRTRIARMEQRNGHYTLRTEAGHRIEARHLVMATGYESQAYLPAPVLDLCSTYAVASERMSEEALWHGRCLIWETATPYLYLRTTADGRAIIGGADEPFRAPKRRDALLPRKTRRLVQAFHKLFPHLRFTAEYAWCGTFGSTKDGLPYIDQAPGTGIWFVLGMGGNGITFSQVGARFVRDAILGHPTPDARLFTFDR